ncbi:hypothetical protein HFV04_025165 [Pseudomonas sp. BIGb0427]|uniref:hypothetical protein n=1 Tax=unclassified Pseudomonas TaxID=196821 RepID=UPI0018A6D6C9|nr:MULTISPECIES: hypothetical protein [unclassified Pseudomonas]QPG62765.1 hypothetical protein HFV04_025165 [Pseudomonas sp. BIGb0427]UVM54164.1 hypothetical protein LOY37_17575 [Pseudomonas sp. B21-012]UVM65170.1 hypothetical protein LOY34_17750 [Pseudomonas sp. B21-009]
MNEYLQYTILLTLFYLLYFLVKPYRLRKRCGIVLFFGGTIASYLLPTRAGSLDIEFIAICISGAGGALFMTRRKYLEQG